MVKTKPNQRGADQYNEDKLERGEKKKENQTREPGKEDKLSERQPLIEPQPKI